MVHKNGRDHLAFMPRTTNGRLPTIDSCADVRMSIGGGLRHHLRMASDQELLRLDPESDACFEELSGIIAEEINVRVALGNSDPTPRKRQPLGEPGR